ncbi:MAG: hypothetical protein AAGG09_15765 [Pseudomonadota bacterium]
MRVTFHIGLHSTDEDRALGCLLANETLLAREGTAVPRPGLFRPALRDAMVSLKGAPAPTALQEHILDAVTATDRPRHIVFSSDSFLCVPQKAVGEDCLYPLAGDRAIWIRNLFPDNDATICFALRNPATLLPAIHARTGATEDFADLMRTIRPEALNWFDMVERLAAGLDGTRIVLWSNEDAPILWPEILALLAGRSDGTAHDLASWDSFLAELLPAEAMTRMRSYLETHPPRDPSHRRRIIAAFLDRFASPDAVEDAVELPGWDHERIADLTARYEADLVRIEQMPFVEVLKL